MDRLARQEALGGGAGCALALQLSAFVMARDKPDDMRALRRLLTDEVMPQASSRFASVPRLGERMLSQGALRGSGARH